MYLYEDKIILTFNYKDGAKTITLAEVEASYLSVLGVGGQRKNWIPTVKKVSGAQMVLFIAEGLFMYFSKEEQRTILHHLTSEFHSGYLLVEMMRPSMMDEKKHDTVKHTGAKFGWGTKSGKEFEVLEPRLRLISEHSFSEQMKKSIMVSRIVGVLTAKINNRLAVFQWGRLIEGA